MTEVRVYVDGSGHATGGPGGCGYVAELPDVTVEASLALPAATNQQAEILAAAFALFDLEPGFAYVVVSDSRYVVDGIDSLPRWIGRGWRTASGSLVANRRHWERLLDLIARHDSVRFEWVRGHNGTAGNERADRLAVAARRQAEAA